MSEEALNRLECTLEYLDRTLKAIEKSLHLIAVVQEDAEYRRKHGEPP